MKRKFSRAEWALMLAPLAVIPLVALLRSKWQFNYPPRERARMQSCQSNLQQIWLATRQYSGDYNGQFPPVSVVGSKVKGLPLLRPNGTVAGYTGTPVGWADALTIYSKSSSLYMCPAEAQSALAPAATNYTDYWMNGNLSSQSSAKLAFPASTLFLGEGNDSTDRTDATYSKTALPSRWLTDTNSPAHRHLGGANYLMADGSVHWLKPQEVAPFGGRHNAFALDLSGATK